MAIGLFFLVVALATAVISWLYQQGGLERVIAFYLTAGMLLGLGLNSVAVGLFNVLYHSTIPLWPWSSLYAFLILPSTSALYHAWSDCYGATMAIGFGLVCIAGVVKIKSPHEKIFGEAHFARCAEIQRQGLFSDEGIVLGKVQGKIIRSPGFEGVLVCAPTGSGKTTSIAIPNLVEWKGSALINDLKGELYETTATYRTTKFGNTCYQWSPASAEKKTARYNPFYYVSLNKDRRIRDVQLIAETLIPAERTDGGFWTTSSRSMFILLALYLLDTQGSATLADIHDLAKQEDFATWLAYTVESEENLDVVFYQNAYSFLGADPDKTQKNILTDFHARMSLFADPLIRHATSGNDFDVRKLRKDKMSIYINIPDSDKERLKPILTLFWAQSIDVLTQQEPKLEEEPYPVLALLDEFGNMAKINQLKNGMSFFRSYRIRPLIIVQYLGQILSTYGQYDSKGFLNAKARLVYTLTDYEDAKFISAQLGEKTVKVKSRSQHPQGITHTLNYQARPLMSPHELLQLKKDTGILLLEGMLPIKVTKCYGFKNKLYRRSVG